MCFKTKQTDKILLKILKGVKCELEIHLEKVMWSLNSSFCVANAA